MNITGVEGVEKCCKNYNRKMLDMVGVGCIMVLYTMNF